MNQPNGTGSVQPGSLNPNDFGAQGTMSTGKNVTAPQTPQTPAKDFSGGLATTVPAQSDVKSVGKPDAWKLQSRTYSQNEQWLKETTIQEVRDAKTNKVRGCLVRVSTQQGDNVAEALNFVQGATAEDFGV